MIKIKVLDDRCLVIRTFQEGLMPDEECFKEFPLEELPYIMPVLKLFTLESLKRIDTLTLQNDALDIFEKNDGDPSGLELDEDCEDLIDPDWRI